MSDLVSHRHGQEEWVRRLHQFWEQNRLQIVVTLALIVVVGGSWGAWVYYNDHREKAAATDYAELPQQEPERTEAMGRLAVDYPTTGAGIYARFQLGRQAYLQKNYDKALAWYEPLTSLSGKQSLIQLLSQNNVATIYEAKGDWDRALQIYQEAAADPNNIAKAYSYYNAGRVSQILGRGEEAREWFRKAIDNGTGMPVAERATERLLWLDIGSH